MPEYKLSGFKHLSKSIRFMLIFFFLFILIITIIILILIRKYSITGIKENMYNQNNNVEQYINIHKKVNGIKVIKKFNLFRLQNKICN